MAEEDVQAMDYVVADTSAPVFGEEDTEAVVVDAEKVKEVQEEEKSEEKKNELVEEENVRNKLEEEQKIRDEEARQEEKRQEEQRLEEQKQEEIKQEEKRQEERRQEQKRQEEQRLEEQRQEEKRQAEEKLEEQRQEEKRREEQRQEEKRKEEKRQEENRLEEIRQEEKRQAEKKQEEIKQEEKEKKEKEHKHSENEIREEIAHATSNISLDTPHTQKRLKITIMTSGTRGDVQPYAVLALALQNRGHKVQVAAEERMHPFIDSFGVPYAHVAGDPTSVLFTKEGQEMLNDGRILRLMSDMKKFQEPTYEECLADYTKACEGADVIITGPLVMTQGYCLAEKNNAVWIPLILGPSFPTDEYPLHMISHSSLPFKFLNKITYSVTFWMLWKSESKQINTWRVKKLGLRPLDGGVIDIIAKQDCVVLNAFTPHLIPGEKKPHDWSKKISLTGFIFPPTGFIPLNRELEEFVNGGVPPVYLGFGSMPAPNPQKLIDITTQVVTQLGTRAVLVAGWTVLNDEMKAKLTESGIFVTDSVPHEWLLPRSSCIVHHGGVGTTAAALRSGVPQVVCPVYLDQPYWGTRMSSLGVAPAPIPFQKLNSALLVAAIQQVFATESMRTRAKQIAAEIAATDGTARNVELIEAIAYRQPLNL